MAEHEWIPVEAVKDRDGEYQFTYRNELGEEHVHVIEGFYDYGNPRACCWKGCSGDWPGCKMTCPAFSQVAEQMVAQQREYEKMPPYDPFNFMLNHTKDIDDHNYYVETFDTLDGTHWEISVDIEQQLLDQLDEETKEDEGSVESEEDEENM